MMESKSIKGNISAVTRIEELMEEERTTIELRRYESTVASEPGLKSILVQLTELHRRSYAQLESYLNELRSSNEITRQINEMFS